MTATTYSIAFDPNATTGPFAPPRPFRSMLDYAGHRLAEAADRLTEWLVRHMVVHGEVYLSYEPPFTIRRHFRHDFNVHMIWLRPVSPQGMAQVVRDPRQSPVRRPEGKGRRQLAGRVRLVRRAATPRVSAAAVGHQRRRGHRMLVLLADEVPASKVKEFVERFVSDYAARGLAQAPDVHAQPSGHCRGLWLARGGGYLARTRATAIALASGMASGGWSVKRPSKRSWQRRAIRLNCWPIAKRKLKPWRRHGIEGREILSTR